MAKILLRRDTSANWQSVNPILGQGELGVELDTGKAKLGDGTTAWNDLAYFKDVVFEQTDKDNIQTALSQAHSHANKALLDALTNSGDGTKFLSDDGTYKIIEAGTANQEVYTFDTYGDLPATGEENQIYLTKDTSTAYMWNGTTSKYEPTSKTEVYATFSDLPTIGVRGRLYLIEDENSIYRWDVATSSYKAVSGGAGATTFDDLTDTPSVKIAGKYVKVSDDGTVLEYADGTGAVNLEGVVSIDSVIDLVNYSNGVEDGTLIFCKSFWPGYTVGGGYFVWDSTQDVNLADYGDFIPSKVLGNGMWVRLKNYGIGFNPSHFGALGDASPWGVTHPLSEFFTTAEEAKWWFPFLDDDWSGWTADECAITNAIMNAQKNASIKTGYWFNDLLYWRDFEGSFETTRGLYFYSGRIKIDLNYSEIIYKGTRHGTLERPQYTLRVAGMLPYRNTGGGHGVPTYKNYKGWWDELEDVWQANTQYNVGDRVRPTGSSYYIYECISGGTSGSSEPTWDENDEIGRTPGETTDGTVVWRTIRAYFGDGYSAMNLLLLKGVFVRQNTSYSEKEFPRVSGIEVCWGASNSRLQDLRIRADWDALVFSGLGMLAPVENIRIESCGRDGMVFPQYYGDFTTCMWVKKCEIANYGRYGINAYTGGIWTDFVFEDIDVEGWDTTRCDGLFSDDYSWYWQGVPAAMLIRNGSDTFIRNVRTEDIGDDHVNFHFFESFPDVENNHEMSYFYSRSSSVGKTQEYETFLATNYRSEITNIHNAYVEDSDDVTHTSLSSGIAIRHKTTSIIYLPKNSGIPKTAKISQEDTVTIREATTYPPAGSTMYLLPTYTNYPVATLSINGDLFGNISTKLRLPTYTKLIDYNGVTVEVLDGYCHSSAGIIGFRDYNNRYSYGNSKDYGKLLFRSRWDLFKPYANFKGLIRSENSVTWWTAEDFVGSLGYVEVDSDGNISEYREQMPFMRGILREVASASPARFAREAPSCGARKHTDELYKYSDTFIISDYYFTGIAPGTRFTKLTITKDGRLGQDWSAEWAVSTNTHVKGSDELNVWLPQESGKTCAVKPSLRGGIGTTVIEQPDYPTWAANTAYGGDGQPLYVMPSTANGFFYEATTAGTSGNTEPAWPTSNGATITDGTVTWTARKIVTWEAKYPLGKMEYTGRVYETNKISGTTADRPTVKEIGFQYFDTDLGKPIYWDGSQWVDANGTAV